MRILVCGSRHLTTACYRVIYERLSKVPLIPGNTLIHGAQRGADLLAEKVARALGWNVQPFPADWTKYRNRAGPIRNRRMLVEGKPELVIAFHTDPFLGKGTRDMVHAAEAAGVPVEIHILATEAA